ncbi:MAG: hypothetical protein HQ582_31510 [Planctomycetes bacterium]|nr:hypothetical protein [Planctomycetota bacterium]
MELSLLDDSLEVLNGLTDDEDDDDEKATELDEELELNATELLDEEDEDELNATEDDELLELLLCDELDSLSSSIQV